MILPSLLRDQARGYLWGWESGIPEDKSPGAKTVTSKNGKAGEEDCAKKGAGNFLPHEGSDPKKRRGSIRSFS